MSFRQAIALYIHFSKVIGTFLAAIIIGPAALLLLVTAFVLALSACFIGVAALLGLIGEVSPATVMAYMLSVGNYLQQHREEILTVGPGLYFLFVVVCAMCFVITCLPAKEKQGRSDLNRMMASRKPSQA
jgi:predicted membrane-bound spermidine synthase